MTINEKQAVINKKAAELYDKFFNDFKPLEQKTMNVKGYVHVTLVWSKMPMDILLFVHSRLLYPL